mmetsp:Transcript_7133/g.21007  ORF Transcript_7133/g.21007 Transcript_7133/m.21007 type:complete len:245 (+) Transcript_7133:723-1457(+)
MQLLLEPLVELGVPRMLLRGLQGRLDLAAVLLEAPVVLEVVRQLGPVGLVGVRGVLVLAPRNAHTLGRLGPPGRLDGRPHAPRVPVDRALGYREGARGVELRLLLQEGPLRPLPARAMHREQPGRGAELEHVAVLALDVFQRRQARLVEARAVRRRAVRHVQEAVARPLKYRVHAADGRVRERVVHAVGRAPNEEARRVDREGFDGHAAFDDLEREGRALAAVLQGPGGQRRAAVFGFLVRHGL